MPFLKYLFITVLASMLAITSWASLRCPLFAVPRDVYAHPWFIATLFDAYWGFITFFVWVCFKRTHWLARSTWLVAILLLGNIAMSAFCLGELFHARPEAGLGTVLTARSGEVGALGPVLAGLGVAVIGFAGLA